MPRVMLDAGHYGPCYNQSPVNKNYYESVFTWKFQSYLKARLEEWGIEVGTTRCDCDENPEVTKRGKKGKGYDLFISIHSDASSKATTDHVTIYHQINLGDYAVTSINFANTIGPAVNAAMMCAQCCSIKQRKSTQGNWDYYGVLRGAAAVKCPAIILEHSYHTNARATNWLLDDENLKALAEVEADVIAEFLGISTLPGDVNGDGKVNAKDYALAKRVVLKTWVPNSAELKRCDINGDGRIDARDYALIKRRSLGTY